MTAAERVEEVLVRFNRALTLDQAIIIAASEASGHGLDPCQPSDAAEILHAELLLRLDVPVFDAIATARATSLAGRTATVPRTPEPSLAPRRTVGSTTRRWWECPCGSDLSKATGSRAAVRTVVSLREPKCPFCRRAYQDKYRNDHTSRGTKEAATRRRPTHPGQGVLSPDHAYPASVFGEASGCHSPSMGCWRRR